MPERERKGDFKGDFVEQLRRLDQALGDQEPSAELDRRMRRTLAGEGEVHPSGWLVRPGLLVVGAGALAVLLLAIFVIRPTPPVTAPSSPLPVAGLEVLGGTTSVRRHDRSLRCISDRCDVRLGPAKVRLLLASGTRVRRRGQHMELIRGTATFAVKPRRRGADSVKIYVSHGMIEVTGTRFRLRQGPEGGSVTLHRGSIRFHASGADQRIVTLRPGQSLSWPIAGQSPGSTADAGSKPDLAAPPSNLEPRPRPRPRPRPGRTVDAGASAPLSPADEVSLRQQVERLRSQGRYADAAAAIQGALPRLKDRARRELYSFELGLILTHHLSNPRRGCRHWRQHLARFGAARHSAEIARARQKLGCP
jgi:FecR protein